MILRLVFDNRLSNNAWQLSFMILAACFPKTTCQSADSSGNYFVEMVAIHGAKPFGMSLVLMAVCLIVG